MFLLYRPFALRWLYLCSIFSLITLIWLARFEGSTSYLDKLGSESRLELWTIYMQASYSCILKTSYHIGKLYLDLIQLADPDSTQSIPIYFKELLIDLQVSQLALLFIRLNQEPVFWLQSNRKCPIDFDLILFQPRSSLQIAIQPWVL